MYDLKKSIYLIGICLTAVFFVSCDKDEDGPTPPDPNASTEEKNNTWIYETMETNYLWYDELPAKKSLNIEEDTEDFFKKLLSGKDGVDRKDGSHMYFSSIEKKREETKAISELDPTYGIEYIIYGVEKQNYYYLRVLYVLPGSPAEEAGLKRDDWVFGINGGDDNITDPYILEEANGITLTLGKLAPGPDGKLGLVKKGELTLPAGRMMDNNPFLLDSIYQIGNKTVGYLVYNHFSSEAEGKTDGAYDTQMKEIFAGFKSKGVNEFVLDLRFNGGGLVNCANLLASLLAPTKVLGTEKFASLQYNKNNSKYNRDLKFDNKIASSNLNLNRLWVLTGQFTASASEAVINGLLPFIDVRIIGDQTVGKAVGSNPYGEDKEEYDWILHPITLKITNSLGTASYGQVGFTPDVYIYEYHSDPFIYLYPLGDKNEKLLSIALDEINGQYKASSLRSDIKGSSSLFVTSTSSLDKKKTKGLVVEKEEE